MLRQFPRHSQQLCLSSSSSGGTPSGEHSRLHNWTPFGTILCTKPRRVEANHTPSSNSFCIRLIQVLLTPTFWLYRSPPELHFRFFLAVKSLTFPILKWKTQCISKKVAFLNVKWVNMLRNTSYLNSIRLMIERLTEKLPKWCPTY